MNENMMNALANVSTCEGRVISLNADNTMSVSFRSITDALGWINMWEIHEAAELATPLKSLTLPVMLKLRILRPSLLGYQNAGYTITSVISHGGGTSMSDFHVMAERPAKGNSVEYAVWAGSTLGDYEYTFYAGYYDAKNHREALVNLRERAIPTYE